MKIKKIYQDLFKMANNIYSELGGGFNETVNQNALAIELRENKINYLKEVNIEIFYKGNSIGTDRPDFVLLASKKKDWNLTEPIVLETKVSSKLTNDNRQQLKSYLKSFPHNKNSLLKSINKGILLNFLKTEDFKNKDEESEKPKIEIEFWSFNRDSNEMELKYKLQNSDD